MFDLNKFSTNVALIDDNGNEYTYAEVLAETIKISDKIQDNALSICLCSNSVESIVGYVSLLNNRTPVILLDEGLSIDYVLKYINEFNVNLLWVPKYINVKGFKCIFKYLNYHLLYFDDSVEVDKELSILIPTSGSTGSKKLVKLSYQNIESNTNAIINYLKLDSKQITITTLPFSYSFGMSIINTLIKVGGKIVVTKKSFFNKEFWILLKNEKVNYISGVPYTFEILDKLRFYKLDLPYIQKITQAGGNLSIELKEKIYNYSKLNNIEFYIMYGQTEASPRISFVDPEKLPEKIKSIGKAIPGGNLYIIDKDDELINEPNITGEIVYEGENVSTGYAFSYEDIRNPVKNKNTILRTGDLGWMDIDGYFFINGRKNRYHKVFGNRINLDELEIILNEKFTERNFLCTGQENSINIFVNNITEIDKIRGYLKSHIDINPIAFKFKEYKIIPRKSNGKVDYIKLNSY